jgi:AcrR family transcriptional regulator
MAPEGLFEDMGQQATKPSRKPRADSQRNRDRLLEAAKAVFSAGGPEASLEAVAKRAGVGIGTLYRHFPTRDALFEAVYRREVEQLGALAEELGREAEPVEALRQWLHATVEVTATKKGMLAALALATDGQAELFAEVGERMRAALTALIGRAVAAGAMRDDIGPEEVMRALYGLVGSYYMRGTPDWQATVLRLVDVFVDGLRRRPGAG